MASKRQEIHKARVKKAIEMREAGRSVEFISLSLGVSTHTVEAYMKDPAARLKKCEDCGEKVTALYRFKGENICERCLNSDYQPSQIPTFTRSSLCNAAYPPSLNR